MIGTRARRRFAADNRGVSVIVGAILIFGFLMLTLAVYQVQVVPQQNAQAEFEHFEDSQNELIELREVIDTAGGNGVTQFPSLTLGTTYQSRLLTVNPPPPTGTIQTSGEHNITIQNDDGEQENVTTRFLEYEPGYNEHDIGPTRLEHSVLYLDERDRGNNVSVIEDQTIVDDGTVTITALQNEFQHTGTERVTLELYPLVDSDIELPDSNDEDYTVFVPTQLTEDEYWDEALEDSGGVYQEVEERDNDPNLLTLEVAENDFELNTVGVQLEPGENTATQPETDEEEEEETDGDTITADRIDDVVEDLADQEQEFEFTLNEEELSDENNVSIDVSEPNDAGVGYTGATANAERGADNAEIIDGGDTIKFEPGNDIDVDDSVVVTVDNLDVGDDTAGQEFDDITFTRNDTQDSSTESFEIQDTITADSISNIAEGTEDEEQEFEFTLNRQELQEDETVSIDVSEPNAAGVDYENATADGDEVTIIDGGDTIEFEAGGNIGAGETITIELEEIDVAADTAGEYNDITFTRDDNQDSSTESFEVTDTITADNIGNLIEDREGQEQTFEFTLETELENGEAVSIDVSEPNAAGVAYDELDDDDLSGTGREARIESGGDTIVFEAGGGGEEGEQSITVENLDVADGSAGDFEDITFTRDDTDGVSTESFRIAETFDASVFVSTSDNVGNNQDIDTSFDATDGEQTFEFTVNIENDGNEFATQEITIDGDTFTLTDDAREDIVDDVATDILDAENLEADQSEVDDVRDEIDTSFQIPGEDIEQDGSRDLTTIEVRSIE